jgi:hypothetical protein
MSSNSNLVESNPFAADDQLELEKAGGGPPAANGPGRPFLPFLNNGKKLTRGEEGGESSPISGDYSDFSNFGPESGALLQDFGGPDFEATEEDDNGDFPRGGGVEAPFFAGAGGGPNDFPSDDSGSDGRYGLDAGGSGGVAGGQDAGGYRGSRGAAAVQARPTRFNQGNANSAKSAETSLPAGGFSGVRQNSGSRPAHDSRQQPGQLESNTHNGNSEYNKAASSFETFANGGNNKNGGNEFDQEYDFGMSDVKGFEDEFPNSGELNFFESSGDPGASIKKPGRPKPGPPATSGKARAGKQATNNIKFPRNRRNFTPDSGRSKMKSKKDEGEEEEEEDGEGFEMMPDRMSQVEEFVSEKSQQANFTTETNNWVPIISKNI